MENYMKDETFSEAFSSDKVFVVLEIVTCNGLKNLS